MRTLASLTPSLRLRTVALAALFGFTTFFVSTAPAELPVPRPEALAPQPAKALACADGPSFEGHLTNTASTTAVATYSTTGNVYAYISDVVDDWSCTAWYRYDGIAWARDDGPPEELDGNFDWGNLINSTSVSCNWDIGETNYLKANSTTDCPDTDAEYALPIFLSNWQTDMLETVWHADHTPDAPGDFGFIHSDCESYYYSESLKENVTWTTSSATNRPGSNCDPYDLESTNTTQSIVVDGTAPSGGSIAIEGGVAWTNDPDVTITASGVDDSPAGVTSIRATVNAGSTWYGWQNYPNINVTLPSGDGTKTVHAQFKDANGNASSGLSYSDTIILDTGVPTGTITIDGGTYTSTASVNLTLTCTDGSGSGPDEMRLRNSGGSWGSWQAFSTSKAWTLTSGSGTRTVDYECRDNAGNQSSTTYSDSIILDPDPPAGSISINGGASTTYSTSVSLTLTCDDSGGSGPEDMRFSANGSSWTSFETFATPKAYVLSGGEGTKTVHYQCTDNASNTSTSSSDTINLVTDVTPPDAPSTPDLDAGSDTGSSDADDITSDQTPTFSGTAESSSTVKLYAGESLVGSTTAVDDEWSITASSLTDGIYAMTATATDPATNESDASSPLSVTIDTDDPDAPGTPDLAMGSDSGASSTDDVTNDSTPTLTGTGPAETTVHVFDGAALVGSGSVIAGAWSVTTTELSDAAHGLTAVATDVAGNESDPSSALSVTIDTADPVSRVKILGHFRPDLGVVRRAR